MSVEIRGASVKGHLSEKCVDIVQREEFLGVEEPLNDRNNALSEGCRDGGIGFLLFVKVRKRGVCGAERADILFDVFDVLRVFAIDKVFDQRVELEAGFGNRFCGFDHLFLMSADWELNDTGGRTAGIGEGVRVSKGVEFKGFIFVLVCDFERLEEVVTFIEVLRGES